MNKETIILDFDGTIVDSIKAFCETYNIFYNGNANHEKIRTWNMSEECPNADVEDIFSSEWFFEKLEFMKDANEIIEKLTHKYNITICSIGTQSNISNKALWIKRNMPYIKDCIFIVNDGGKMDKSCIQMQNAIAFIDDNMDNLKSSNCYNENKFCFGKKYDFNRNWFGKWFKDWTEIEEYFLKTLDI